MLRGILALAAAAAAATIPVAVGKDGLTFTPSSVTAGMGDIIEYSFFPPNHSVVMGDFDHPCSPAATGGFFSGFFAGSGGNVFRVVVNTTDPIFFYCGFPTHCQTGMVGVVNPSGAQTLDAFMSQAAGTSGTGVPNHVFGGTVVAASGSSTTGSAAPSPTKGNGGDARFGSASKVMVGVSVAGVLAGVLMA